MAERAHPEDAGFQDRWFGLKKNKYRRKLIERYRFCNRYLQGKEVVDVPCGTGWGTSMLKGYRFARGIDIAPDAIEFARGKYERKGKLEFGVGDMSQIPVADRSIDVLICLEGFEHVSQEIGAAFVEEAKRLLRRDGLLIMTCPVLDEHGKDTGNPHHVYEYPEEELIDIANRHFRIQSLERVQGPEGPEYRMVVSNIAGQRYLPR